MCISYQFCCWYINNNLRSGWRQLLNALFYIFGLLLVSFTLLLQKSRQINELKSAVEEYSSITEVSVLNIISLLFCKCPSNVPDLFTCLFLKPVQPFYMHPPNYLVYFHHFCFSWNEFAENQAVILVDFLCAALKNPHVKWDLTRVTEVLVNWKVYQMV